MHRILKILSRNLISILGLMYCIIYLLLETPDLATALAVVCAIYVLLGGALILGFLCQKIIYERERAIPSILNKWISIVLFIACCVYLYAVKDGAFLSAFLIGDAIFAGFFVIYFLVKRQFQ